jgi:hypothetical protein
MPPTIAVAIPTIGRSTLARSLDAIAPQVISGDEIFVVQDTHAVPDLDLSTLVATYGPAFRYEQLDAGISFKGVYQTNRVFSRARTDLVLAHSDDDVFAPHAFATLRTLAEEHPLHPILFRCISPRGYYTWPTGTPQLKRHKLGGGSLAAPRRYLKPFHMKATHVIEGVGYSSAPPDLVLEGVDYYWVCEVLAHAAADGHLPVWTDEVLMHSNGRSARADQ